jgi:putative transcriptional regulator
MPKLLSDPAYLGGQMLIAMPGMPDPRFEKSVLYLCAHSASGAMGIIVNRPFEAVQFNDLMEQLGIEPSLRLADRPVLFGGPVEMARGFVLHTTDMVGDDSIVVDDRIALTATLDILRAIAEGTGPQKSLFALGYAGWDAGQLDAEIQQNGWLTAPADPDLLFDPHLDDKWTRALKKLGIDPALLVLDAGHA